MLPDCPKGFPSGTSGKESTCQCKRCKRLGFDLWVVKIPWRRKWQPTLVFLPGTFHGQKSLEGYTPRGHKRQQQQTKSDNRLSVQTSPGDSGLLGWGTKGLSALSEEPRGRGDAPPPTLPPAHCERGPEERPWTWHCPGPLKGHTGPRCRPGLLCTERHRRLRTWPSRVQNAHHHTPHSLPRPHLPNFPLCLFSSSGEGNGNPLQCSCLENPMDKRNLVGYSSWGCKELDTTKRLHFCFSFLFLCNFPFWKQGYESIFPD